MEVTQIIENNQDVLLFVCHHFFHEFNEKNDAIACTIGPSHMAVTPNVTGNFNGFPFPPYHSIQFTE